MASSRLKGKVGLKSGSIKIFNSKTGYSIHLENDIFGADAKKIAAICPAKCFEVVNANKKELIGFKEDESDSN